MLWRLAAYEILLTLTKFYQRVEDPPTRKALWDMSSATIMTISISDMDEIVALRLNHEGTMAGGKTAIVAFQDANFGLARMFELKTTGTDRELMVFRTYKEASEWIEK